MIVSSHKTCWVYEGCIVRLFGGLSCRILPGIIFFAICNIIT